MSSSSAFIPLRVLFVEDNDFLRLMTAELLVAPDREIVACSSAEQALAAFEREPFDVVITDVSLPEMSGMDLVKQLLKLTPDLWVLICSGYRLETDLEKLGVNVRALPKPFEPNQVDALLTHVRG